MSAVYPKAKEALLTCDLCLGGKTVKAILIDTADYAYSDAHVTLVDVPSIAQVATSPALTGMTFTNGVFDATNAVLTAVSGDPCEAIIVYVDTGTPATSRLVCYIDIPTFTPDGGNCNIAWDEGPNKIFAL